jgi:hypothetical protein
VRTTFKAARLFSRVSVPLLSLPAFPAFM